MNQIQEKSIHDLQLNLVNVSDHLTKMAESMPDSIALHIPQKNNAYQSVSFLELNNLTNQFAHGLLETGICRGMRTVLMVPPSLDFFALTFALFRLAAVPVLIDPGMGVKNLGPSLATAQPQAFIGISKANFARKLFGWGRSTIHTTVNVGRSRFFCNASTKQFHQQSVQPVHTSGILPNHLAAILFTSGSTGPAKGVEYTHGIFSAQVEMLKQMYDIKKGEVDFCSFPLFALFGPALGMTCVIPEMDASKPASINPRKAITAINRFKVTNLFGSPVVIRRLTEVDAKLPTVKRAISAGAPATMAVVRKFQTMLNDDVELFTPYGATESLPVANVGSRQLLNETSELTKQGKGVCLGKPVQGMTVRIIKITDSPITNWSDELLLPAGNIGEIVVSGPVVTRQYYNKPEQTQLAKIVDAKTNTLWHRMGDVGYYDEHGNLWFCGRKSHRVLTVHGVLFTDMVEPIFNQLEAIERTALVGVKQIAAGENHLTATAESKVAVVWVELTREAEEKSRKDKNFNIGIVEQLIETAKKHEHTRSIDHFIFHHKFPVDVRHNSKIFREKLAVEAEHRLKKMLKKKR